MKSEPWLSLLPSLDTHAHMGWVGSTWEVRTEPSSVVFAMTNSIAEAKRVTGPVGESVLWGIGVHPNDRRALLEFDIADFRSELARFLVVGEIGLDRSAGSGAEVVFREVLRAIGPGRPGLVSIHSYGRIDEVLGLLQRHPVRGAVLHWFLGDARQIRRAQELGCFFSVNARMRPGILAALPPDRVLTETDFPATGQRPGDVDAVVQALGAIWVCSGFEVQQRLLTNARNLLVEAGIFNEVPDALADALLAV